MKMRSDVAPCPARRRLLGAGLGFGASLLLPGCDLPWLRGPRVAVFRPGMDLGHAVRDSSGWPEPSAEWSCDVLIAGSGAAALTAAWKLAREGRSDFVLIEGPEPDGNNAGGADGELRYPTGAHYLALPSRESAHVRELLADLGILRGNPAAERPEYDESVLVHAPEERLLRNGVWQEEMLPATDDDTRRFFAFVASLSQAWGDDGRKPFAMPIVFSSQDVAWRALDRLTFAQWLEDNDYRSESLRWYLDYCCRDDYGQGIAQVSAWAGLHYFASRGGQAKHAENGAVLTWPDGLGSLSRMMRARIGLRRASALRPEDHDGPQGDPRVMSGVVLRMAEQRQGVDILLGIPDGETWRTVRVRAAHAVCAMPLYIASRVVQGLADRGFDPTEHLPVYAPWLVSNFVFDRFPQEPAGAPLAWDNVAQDGKGLGYVVSTHQLIRVARPPRTAFTAYHALDHEDPGMVRAMLLEADGETLLKLAAGDLELAYGKALWTHLSRVDVTVRGHAMAAPRPGYLSNAGLLALREGGSRLLFAHADLSGYSVFEEASWWGYRAALRLL